MRIDPSRLSRLLLALQKPEAARSNESDRAKQTTTQTRGSHTTTRDIKVLRKEIQSRLKALDKMSEDYDSAAASITIQEILRWEFGSDILDHSEFNRISSSIAQTLLADEKMAVSLQKLARDLS